MPTGLLLDDQVTLAFSQGIGHDSFTVVYRHGRTTELVPGDRLRVETRRGSRSPSTPTRNAISVDAYPGALGVHPGCIPRIVRGGLERTLADLRSRGVYGNLALYRRWRR
jgi:hypothetical protein